MKNRSWEVTAPRPDGGYVPIRADVLFAAWWCYETSCIRLADLRLWFALHEVAARRCRLTKGRQPEYTTDELRELSGHSRSGSVKASLGRLEQAGLAKARRSAITFPDSVDDVALPDRPAFDRRLQLITNHRRRVPVPRRVLRWLVSGARRVLIATTLGHLLRLLYLRGGTCRADGNCKASWLAAVFGITVRSVKQGRRRLIEEGLLIPQETPAWYRNRYGWRGAVHLGWTVDHSNDVSRPSKKRTPPPTRIGTKPSPPRQDRKLSSRSEHQKPARRRIGSSGKGMGPLGEIQTPQLRDDVCLQRLLSRAISSRLVTPCDRLNVFAAAEHALRVGTRNPAGLFIWLLVRRRWDYLTQADEDAARCRLQRLAEPCGSKVGRKMLCAVQNWAAGRSDQAATGQLAELLLLRPAA